MEVANNLAYYNTATIMAVKVLQYKPPVSMRAPDPDTTWVSCINSLLL